MAYLDESLVPYDKKKARKSIQSYKPKKRLAAQGKLVPVPRNRNKYVTPNPGGGSGPTTPVSQNRAGVDAQTRAQANRPAVSTDVEVNYESDPVLAKIKALGQQSVGNAQTEAAKLRKQAVIDTGLADVGQEIGLDAGTLQAARENPLSVAARIARESALRNAELDESLNQQNLFWSGHRGTQLANLGRDTMEEQANLVRDLRAALGGIDAGVLEAQQAAALEEQDALADAAAAAHAAAQQQAFMDALLGSTPATVQDAGFNLIQSMGSSGMAFNPPSLGDPRMGLTPKMPAIPYVDPLEEMLVESLGGLRY